MHKGGGEFDRQVAALHNGYPAWEVHGLEALQFGVGLAADYDLAKPQR